jgi:hypothetical protein
LGSVLEHGVSVIVPVVEQSTMAFPAALQVAAVPFGSQATQVPLKQKGVGDAQAAVAQVPVVVAQRRRVVASAHVAAEFTLHAAQSRRARLHTGVSPVQSVVAQAPAEQ